MKKGEDAYLLLLAGIEESHDAMTVEYDPGHDQVKAGDTEQFD